jgi:hypothetical protein
MQMDIDSLWIGRDYGYRGGRRTGLALTDDGHVGVHMKRWGLAGERVTRGAPIGERTATVVWRMLGQISAPIFLWNVFPLHPHEYGDPFTNRSHNVAERSAGEELLSCLIDLLHPRRLVAIGRDAASSAQQLATNQTVVCVRHPSYGGQPEFERQIATLYLAGKR